MKIFATKQPGGTGFIVPSCIYVYIHTIIHDSAYNMFFDHMPVLVNSIRHVRTGVRPDADGKIMRLFMPSENRIHLPQGRLNK